MSANNFSIQVDIESNETCSWQRHCHGCACDLIGILELLARLNPDRFVLASVSTLTRLCNGKYRDGGPKPYSQSMVKRALRLFREQGIVSRRVVMTVKIKGKRRCGPGIVVTPHDALTKRYPAVCHVVSIGKAPGTFVDGVWFKEAISAEFFGVVVEGDVAL